MAFASEGVKVICYDIDEKAVKGINLGKVAVTNLEFWYGASMGEFVEKGLVKASVKIPCNMSRNRFAPGFCIIKKN